MKNSAYGNSAYANSAYDFWLARFAFQASRYKLQTIAIQNLWFFPVGVEMPGQDHIYSNRDLSEPHLGLIEVTQATD